MASVGQRAFASGIPADLFERELQPSSEKPYLTEFEKVCEDLALTPHFYEFSNILRRWCEKNRNRRYVPEWLLKKWGMEVRVYESDEY